MSESDIGKVSSAIEQSIVWHGGVNDEVQNTVSDELKNDTMWDIDLMMGIGNKIEYAMPDILNNIAVHNPEYATFDGSVVDRLKQDSPLGALVGTYLEERFQTLDTSDDGIIDNVELSYWDYGLNRRVPDANGTWQDGKLEWTASGQTSLVETTAQGDIATITQSGANPNRYAMDQNSGLWYDSQGTQYGPFEIIPYETKGTNYNMLEPVQYSAAILSGSNKGGWILGKADNSEITSNEALEIRKIRYPNGDQRLFFYNGNDQLAAMKFVDANGADHTTDLSDSHPQLFRDGTLIVSDGDKSTVYFTNGETRKIDAAPAG